MTDATTVNANEAQAAVPETAEQTAGAGRQMWLAGLGLVALVGKGLEMAGKGVKQGGRAFDALVEQGKEFEPNVTGGLHRVRDEVTELTGKMKSAVSQAEGTFDEKVRASMQRIGIPTTDEVRQLSERVEALARRVEEVVQKTADENAGEHSAEEQTEGEETTGEEGKRKRRRSN